MTSTFDLELNGLPDDESAKQIGPVGDSSEAPNRPIPEDREITSPQQIDAVGDSSEAPNRPIPEDREIKNYDSDPLVHVPATPTVQTTAVRSNGQQREMSLNQQIGPVGDSSEAPNRPIPEDREITSPQNYDSDPLVHVPDTPTVQTTAVRSNGQQREMSLNQQIGPVGDSSEAPNRPIPEDREITSPQHINWDSLIEAIADPVVEASPNVPGNQQNEIILKQNINWDSLLKVLADPIIETSPNVPGKQNELIPYQNINWDSLIKLLATPIIETSPNVPGKQNELIPYQNGFPLLELKPEIQKKVFTHFDLKDLIEFSKVSVASKKAVRELKWIVSNYTWKKETSTLNIQIRNSWAKYKFEEDATLKKKECIMHCLEVFN